MRVRLFLSLAFLALALNAGAIPVYVGLFQVSDGPSWKENPRVLSAREAAALIFGGHYTDYAISTERDTINHNAWLDGWGDTRYLAKPHHEDFKQGDYYLDALKQGYSFSAYVSDHTEAAAGRYNYVWRINGSGGGPVVPEPMTILMLGSGSLGIVMLRRRRPASAARRESAPQPDDRPQHGHAPDGRVRRSTLDRLRPGRVVAFRPVARHRSDRRNLHLFV
ncbi:MAG: hypothetical protein BWZ08_00633 [candidate division BRC1 bacterium ADurb.BinA292]|nr:MAG: hypothetical protein BWZ08_00633 [candidate division BRC1 bacterium ADurb.BinA292]